MFKIINFDPKFEVMRFYAIVLFLSFLSVAVVAQDEVKINKNDLSRFIKTFKPMTEELEALGANYKAMTQMNALDALKANNELLNLLEKYGWDENSLMKWAKIGTGYSYVKMEEQMEQIPEAQRAQFEAAMQMQGVNFNITDQEKDLIKGRISELEELFENL